MKFIEKHKPWVLLCCVFIGAGLSKVFNISEIDIPDINIYLGIFSMIVMSGLVWLGYYTSAKKLC